ncbi:hypothetical protein GCM10020358_82900 [Amorphoplanes nipponensis]|uniref:hypothetical protein n=1 Tax=Actinoplanes nipponensis TaxID=135950 RepID=UPI0031ED7047
MLIVAPSPAAEANAWLLGADPVALGHPGPTPLQVLGEVAMAMVWGATLHFALILPGARCSGPAAGLDGVRRALPAARRQLNVVPAHRGPAPPRRWAASPRCRSGGPPQNAAAGRLCGP